MFSEIEKCLVPFRVIVIGAGLGGLSAAVALGRRGHSVLVLESSSQLLSVGAGVAVPPAIREWFESEGVLQPGDKTCGAVEGIKICRWDTGNLTAQTAANPLGKLHAIYHGDLQSALVARARQLEDIEIRLGTRVADIDVGQPAVFLASGERIPCDAVIVADGVKSTLKHRICLPEAAKAQPTGDAAYRFALPRQLLENDEDLMALVQQPFSKRWDGPHGHVVAYPICNHQLLNLVFIHPDAGHAEESWTYVTDKAHLTADFQGWDPVLHKLIHLAPDKVPNFRLLVHPVSPVWVKGSAVLLGDACHAMLPYLAQGVGQAVEDATAITTVLSVIESRELLPVALEAYAMSRKPRVEDIQSATKEARQYLHLKDGEEQATRDQERAAASEAMQNSDVIKLQQSFWVWDAAQAAQDCLQGLRK